MPLSEKLSPFKFIVILIIIPFIKVIHIVRTAILNVNIIIIWHPNGLVDGVIEFLFIVVFPVIILLNLLMSFL
jgi:hypothetical protein